MPKVMVSTVASGDVKPYVGPSDICMMYSVTDVSGINRISERVLANAAHALAGMIAYAKKDSGAGQTKPALGLTRLPLFAAIFPNFCEPRGRKRLIDMAWSSAESAKHVVVPTFPLA